MLSLGAVTRLGIMQGRLVPPEPGRFQAFPRDRWQTEFRLAAQVPLAYIEWIFDEYGADVNPLTGDIGALQSVIRDTNVSTHAMCADYFMDRPFLRCSDAERAQRQEMLHRLLRQAKQAGISRVVLPFVDASRIETEQDKETVIDVLKNALPAARETGVELHLETALNPKDFADLLDRVPDPLVGVNYDSGNSSSLGYVAHEEFAAYGDRIGSIHIKDRVLSGGTVPLGTGGADFPSVFREMENLGYDGDITMQVARGNPGDELAWARSNRDFIAQYWPLD